MDPRLQTSFIPKKPIVAQPGSRAPHPINLFSLIASVIFIVAIALSGGVYFYHGLIVKQIEADKISLDKAQGAFEPDLIEEIVKLDKRIETGKVLLKSHIAITPLFDLLSSITLKSVRFKDFSFSYLGADKILVVMKGQAQSYTAVALESDLLNKQKYLSNTILGDMALDSTGTISFSVSTTIDSSLTSYAAALSRGNPVENTNTAPNTTTDSGLNSSTTPQ